MFKLNGKSIQIAAYIYLLVPFLIFSATWLKTGYAVVVTVLLLVGLAFMCKDTPKGVAIDASIKVVFMILLIVVAWCYFSGIGGYVYQNADHPYRNQLFHILSTEKWPIRRTVIVDGIEENRGMSYYFGFWLPAAAVSKIMGEDVGKIALLCWAIVGVLIFFALLCISLKKVKVWPVLVFVAFSGVDIWANYVTGQNAISVGDWIHLESWTIYQYSSFTTQLFWVYNQAIPAWILTLLILQQEKNRNLFLIWASGLMLCTIPAVGLIPFVVFVGIKNVLAEKKPEDWKHAVKAIFKDALTYQNVVCGLLIVGLSITLLLGNTAVGATSTAQATYEWRFVVMQYIVTMFFEVVLFYVVVYRANKNNMLYYLVVAWLLICPFIKVGTAEDFCMRASIPALVILSIFVIQSLEKYYVQKDYVLFLGVIALVILGAATPSKEINRTITNTLRGEYQMQFVEEEVIYTGWNFSTDADTNIFYNLFAEE